MIQAGSLIAALRSDDSLSDKARRDAAVIECAHKFLVTNVDLILRDEVREYGALLLESGLLPLPYPQSFFEFDNWGPGMASRISVLVDATPPHEGGPSMVMFSGYVKKANAPEGAEWGVLPAAAYWCDGVICALNRNLRTNDIRPRPYDEAEAKEMAVELARLVAAAIGFMDMQHASVSEVQVLDRVNKKRLSAGKPPFYSHKVLSLRKSARAAVAAHSARLRERRAHWRRGHLRHLQDGRLVPVSPALVRGRGFISKEYRV